MNLSATIAPRELAGLLDVSTGSVEELINQQEISAWTADRVHFRVGWRTARSLIAERYEEDPAKLAPALETLQGLRAGLVRLRGNSDPSVFEPTGEVPVAADRCSDEQLIELVRQADQELALGGCISETQFTRWAMSRELTAHEICVRLTRSWGDVLKLSGLTARAREATPLSSREDRLAILREAAAALGGGKRVSHTAFDCWADRQGLSLTAAAYVGMFETWNNAKRAAGLEISEHRDPVQRTNDELLELMREAARELDAPALTSAQFEGWCKEHAPDVAASLVYARHGSWNEGKRRAGLIPRSPSRSCRIGRTDRYGDRKRVE